MCTNRTDFELPSNQGILGVVQTWVPVLAYTGGPLLLTPPHPNPPHCPETSCSLAILLEGCPAEGSAPYSCLRDREEVGWAPFLMLRGG